jgi:hypothetical protein
LSEESKTEVVFQFFDDIWRTDPIPLIWSC